MTQFANDQQSKILILQGQATPNGTVAVAGIYRNVNSFTKKLKKFHEHLPIPFEEIWYGQWKNKIVDYDVFIIFDAIRSRHIISYIHNLNPSARIILYYINKFKSGAKNDPANFRNMPCELWSFDKNDCKLMQMRFNPYYYDEILANVENLNAFNQKPPAGSEIYDAFFIGVDKNRLETLIKVKTLLEKYRYKTKFIVRKNQHKSYRKYPDNVKDFLTVASIKYKDVIQLIHQSKTIIEIQCSGQNGLTLRAMESLFFQKKLITDNHDIVNYDFYKKENIFIIGHDPEERLDTFLVTPYEPVAEHLLQQFTFTAWLERFFR